MTEDNFLPMKLEQHHPAAAISPASGFTHTSAFVPEKTIRPMTVENGIVKYRPNYKVTKI
jgi:hypothetical protein